MSRIGHYIYAWYIQYMKQSMAFLGKFAYINIYNIQYIYIYNIYYIIYIKSGHK